MKEVMKGLLLGLMIFGLANCGGGGGGGGGTTAPAGKTIAADAKEIAFSDFGSDSKDVVWDNEKANLYYATGDGCAKILGTSNSNVVESKSVTMVALLNSAKVLNGTGDGTNLDLPRIVITDKSGKKSVYYLAEQADVAPEDQVLSNSEDVLDFFVETREYLETSGAKDCGGKGKNK